MIIVKEKMKIISVQDVVTICLALILIVVPFLAAFASGSGNSNVTARNLAMFAALSYADIENIPGKSYKVDTSVDNLTYKSQKMMSDSDLKKIYTSTKILGILDLSATKEKENTYDYLFYKTGASMSELNGWELMNYSKIKTVNINKFALFTGMTFRKGDNIVIAFRGTDFDDIGDWLQDFLGYLIVGDTRHQTVAGKYATEIAKKAIAENPNTRIYVTGHSLGGFLAQIGGAELLNDNETKSHVEEIAYFNGMGLHPFDGMDEKQNEFKQLLRTNLSKEFSQKLNKFDSDLNKFTDAMLTIAKDKNLKTTQDTAEKTLKEWYNQGGKLIAYRIDGDIVSSVGKHCGEVREYKAVEACINHQGGNKKYTSNLNRVLVKNLAREVYNEGLLTRDLSKIVDDYKPGGLTVIDCLASYLWITHETDSFLGVTLNEPSNTGRNNAENPYLRGSITTPGSLGKNKTATITFTLTTNGTLSKQNLTANDFKISSSLVLSRITITNISKPTITKSSDGKATIYKYTITIKTGLLKENAIIYMPSEKIKVNNTGVSNSKIATNTIKVN